MGRGWELDTATCPAGALQVRFGTHASVTDGFAVTLGDGLTPSGTQQVALLALALEASKIAWVWHSF
jgi:hypothetical protein